MELAALLRDVGAELRLELEGRTSTLEIDCPAGLSVRADPDRIHQAVANLVINALKFGRRGDPVWVRGAMLAQMVVVEVRDAGRRIPPDELARLGAAFTRASNADEVAGTGLGLGLVRELVELHGGSLEVDSELGQGATLRLRLPASGSVGDGAPPRAGALPAASSLGRFNAVRSTTAS